MNWLATVVAPVFAQRRPLQVLEIGSLNVNGSAREVLQKYAGAQYLGIDRQPGAGVDWVGDLQELILQPWAELPAARYDAIIATEAFEHDPTFWITLRHMRLLSRMPALWVITTPANGFPWHGWPNDYYRFTEDAYRDVFFADMEILDLRTVDGGGHEKAVCGLAVLDVRP
jgi:hypothetical protein